jgi:MOSC domain-containing protein YiiM
MLPRMAQVLSVNLAVPRSNPAKEVGITGIDKRPADGPVTVRPPGPGGSGLDGDKIYDIANHGGADQAVYAYAREDLDAWGDELGQYLPGGAFGENLTTSGLDVTGALIGERWRIGPDVLLEVAVPRIPCGTFAHWMASLGAAAERGWQKRFTQRAVPGAYLRVVTGGQIRAGDPVEVTARPDHDVTIGITFRALTREAALLPRLRDIEALPDGVRELATRRTVPFGS